MRSAPALSLACAAALLGGAALAADPPAAPGELPPLVFEPSLKLRVDIHGSLYLWYYQPLVQLEDPRPGSKPLGPDDRAFEIYVASIELSAKLGDFGVYVNPRFRDTKSRDFFTSNVWLQQGYLSNDLPHALIKVGKIENAASRLSDDSFYLNLLYFDGIKYEADYGVSAEGSLSWDSGLALGYAAQYFIADGATNGSLRDRDTVWITGARRRDIGVLRLEPSYRFSKESSLRFGVAAEAFRVDLGTGAGYQPVARLDADVSFVYGPARIFAEGLAQLGQTVTSYPFAPTATEGGRASAHNYYALAGAGVRLWRFYPRYSVSFVRYADGPVNEFIHVPGVTFVAHDNVSFMFEYAYWGRADPGRSWMLDNSINVLAYGKF